MRKINVLLACAVAWAIGMSSAFAETATPQYDRAGHDPRYDKNSEGWYWYNDPEARKEIQELKELLKRLPPPEAKEDRAKSDAEYAKENPFSAQWVRVMLPKYMDIAWNNPTPENVQAYFLVQKFALDRSQEFANTARKVVTGNILLDNSVNRPVSAAGAQMANTETAEKKAELLKNLSSKIGVFFFYRSTCSHCERQAPVISMLEKNFGYNVMAISMDGGPLQSASFKNTKANSGQAERLGVQSVPAIYLMNEKGEFDLISNSLISYDNLKDRILIAADRQGWISQADAEKIHFRINTELKNNLSRELPKVAQAIKNKDLGALMGMDASKIESVKNEVIKNKGTIQAKDGFIDPKVLVTILNKGVGNNTAYPYSGSLANGR